MQKLSVPLLANRSSPSILSLKAVSEAIPYYAWTLVLSLVSFVNKTSSPGIDQLKLKYGSVFSGLGCHKRIKAKLIVDQHVEPIAHKKRKIPYNLEKKAHLEVERLKGLGVIEEVPDNTPTTWCSNPVVVPKPHNPDKIRYCSDMRMPNTAIKCPVL